MTTEYDSRKDTLEHIANVEGLIHVLMGELAIRKDRHDMSKIFIEEKKIFDVYTPKLKSCTYGSEEYRQYLKEMKPALEHHYKNNSHHPEHYINGINEMDLIDICEMLCDWKAATKRHHDGDIFASILLNKNRFTISEQLTKILQNTVERYFQYEVLK